MGLYYVTSLILCSVGLYVVKILILPNRKKAPLPPSPSSWPLIGNITDLPKPGELECLHWLKHKDLHGPLSSVTILGQTLIIINDTKVAIELMEKRSALHSSRPKQTFAGEIIGWENSMGLSPYSNRLRAYRKETAKILGSIAAVSHFSSLQEVEVGRFLLRLLEAPDELLEHIRKEAGAIILKISYGYTIEPRKPDPLVDLAIKAMDQFGRAGVPGAYMVDMIPILKYLPEWFPAAGFQRIGREWRETLNELTERPFEFVKHQMAHGKYEPSFSSHLLESGNLSPEETYTVKLSAMSMYAGGADTTVSSMACFFLAMTEFPDVQRKAQNEIDRVVGTDRLPKFEDRINLPYIDAVVKEVLRWHPVAPMGIPHMSTADDIYEGYLIPKGALLLPNIWAFTHDPEVYHDPLLFKPERFLSMDGHPAEPDPHKISFGFGRRICPGRFLADASLFLNISQVLAVYKISNVGNGGHGFELEKTFLPGVISHPAPFKAAIEPRSPQHEALIRSIEDIHPWQKSDADVLRGILKEDKIPPK